MYRYETTRGLLQHLPYNGKQQPHKAIYCAYVRSTYTYTLPISSSTYLMEVAFASIDLLLIMPRSLYRVFLFSFSPLIFVPVIYQYVYDMKNYTWLHGRLALWFPFLLISSFTFIFLCLVCYHPSQLFYFWSWWLFAFVFLSFCICECLSVVCLAKFRQDRHEHSSSSCDTPVSGTTAVQFFIQACQ